MPPHMRAGTGEKKKKNHPFSGDQKLKSRDNATLKSKAQSQLCSWGLQTYKSIRTTKKKRNDGMKQMERRYCDTEVKLKMNKSQDLNATLSRRSFIWKNKHSQTNLQNFILKTLLIYIYILQYNYLPPLLYFILYIYNTGIS